MNTVILFPERGKPVDERLMKILSGLDVPPEINMDEELQKLISAVARERRGPDA